MNIEFTKMDGLVDKHSSLFSPDHKGRRFSFWCDEGWLDIISAALQCIEQYLKRVEKISGNRSDFKFAQIKEKFGGLRIYNDGYSDDYIHGVIDMAEAMSYKTCEVTGRPGFLCKKGTWVKTLCLEKAEELGYSKYERPTTKGENDT
jgi:hypothetical protein